jgi:hypothetical protein
MRILIQRSRKPLLISMGSIFPVLSLQYYANVRHYILFIYNYDTIYNIYIYNNDS